jgi:hypothetical protein
MKLGLLWLCMATSLAACGTVTATAPRSIQPVLIGPVRSIGPTGVPGPAIATFRSRARDYAAASGGGNTSTATHYSSAATQLDFDVLIRTNGRLGRTVSLSKVDCATWGFMLIAGAIQDVSCVLDGTINEAHADPPAAEAASLAPATPPPAPRAPPAAGDASGGPQ